jgi:hypothetical protein
MEYSRDNFFLTSTKLRQLKGDINFILIVLRSPREELSSA